MEGFRNKISVKIARAEKHPAVCQTDIWQTVVLPLLVIVFAGMQSGCRMGAPIHVWQPPVLQSTVGKTVVVPPLSGPPETANAIHKQLLASTPRDAGRQTTLVDPQQLPPANVTPSGIALVSYEDNDVSDLAINAQARRAGADFVLRGEILADRRRGNTGASSNPRLLLSWHLTPLISERDTKSTRPPEDGCPVALNLETSLERYPDLHLAGGPEEVLRAAAVREAIPLITPSVQRDRVQLEIPYGFLGSREIRRGNLSARQGRWAEAEASWKSVYQKYPWSSVAVHHLAIAAVARQDFSEARRLAKKAVRMRPTKLHKETLVWVEQTQRAFHEAFELPDPPEGWSITRSAG